MPQGGAWSVLHAEREISLTADHSPRSGLRGHGVECAPRLAHNNCSTRSTVRVPVASWMGLAARVAGLVARWVFRSGHGRYLCGTADLMAFA